MTDYLNFWKRMIAYAFKGGSLYYAWIGGLAVMVVGGLIAYSFQVRFGLSMTNMSDPVSWGAYIANFTFLVGVAAAAVLLVVPGYIYKQHDLKKVTIFGELMAISAIIMCLCFVVVDLGRPDRLLHIIPGIGKMNFPHSILAWDVIVLNGYLLLNLHIPGYLLYKKYRGENPSERYYVPFVLVSIFWAVSIHTVTAFLYSGLGGRPYWNSALMAPRFLVSAFASGPAFMYLIFSVLKDHFEVPSTVFSYLVKVIRFTVPLSLFLLFCEIFKEFYTDTQHVSSAEYLYFGLHGHTMLVPFIWGALLSIVAALVLLMTPKYAEQPRLLRAACVLIILGIWVEKGMGLIVPGFVPSPTGQIVEYTPSIVEFFVSLGIWSLGGLVFTLMARVAIGIETHKLTLKGST